MSIIKKPDDDAPQSFVGGKLVTKQTKFRQRVAEARAAQQTPDSMPNRLGLMLDCSGSMSGDSISLLKQAVDNFVNRCNPTDTSLAIDTFPPSSALPLTNVYLMVTQTAQALSAGGGTPMRSCVERCAKLPLTRAVLVSDGDATDWGRTWREDEVDSSADKVLDHYVESKIPIDCVHIGSSTGGESLLRSIAEKTGGLYIKFTDVSAFSTAFGYLTPGSRALLTEGKVSASALGAKEIER